MIGELDLLVKLQRIDKQLQVIDVLKGDLPLVVEQLKQTINQLEKEIASNKNRDKEITLEIKRLEGQISDDKQALNRYQDQLYLVTSNKEYDALTFEIDEIKKKIDAAEYTILTLNEEQEKLKVTLKGNELTLAEKLKDLEVKQAELDKTELKTQAQQSELQKQRADLVSQIPLRYLREYERIAKAKNGLAVVSIKTDYEERVDKKGNVEYIPLHVSCGGCHKIVPPQKVVEIKSGRYINRCESCGRILYFDQGEFQINSSDEEDLY